MPKPSKFHPTVGFAQDLAKLREAHPANADFSKAMQDAGYGNIGANDRAALLRIAKLDPDKASQRLWLSRYDRSPPQYQWCHDLAFGVQPAAAKKPTVTLYHRCTPAKAKAILAHGFRNNHGHYTPDHPWEGVLFSDEPEPGKGKAVLAVTLLADSPSLTSARSFSGIQIGTASPVNYYLLDADARSFKNDLLALDRISVSAVPTAMLIMEPCEGAALEGVGRHNVRKALRILRDRTLTAEETKAQVSSLVEPK